MGEDFQEFISKFSQNWQMKLKFEMNFILLMVSRSVEVVKIVNIEANATVNKVGTTA